MTFSFLSLVSGRMWENKTENQYFKNIVEWKFIFFIFSERLVSNTRIPNVMNKQWTNKQNEKPLMSARQTEVRCHTTKEVPFKEVVGLYIGYRKDMTYRSLRSEENVEKPCEMKERMTHYTICYAWLRSYLQEKKARKARYLHIAKLSSNLNIMSYFLRHWFTLWSK